MESPQAAPSGEDLQLVYRIDLNSALAECEIPGASFHLVTGPATMLRVALPYLRTFGTAAVLKDSAKVATAKRDLYLWTISGRVAHRGWLNVGFCRYYPVDARDVVIGPIWSDKAQRGKGLATEGMRRAMNAMLKRGFERFFIDTTENNVATQKVTSKVGFGEPVAHYRLGDDGSWLEIERPS